MIAEVEIVRVELKLGVPEDGLRLAIAPDGRPRVERLTVEVNPPVGERETIAVTGPPCTTDPELGLTLMLKSGDGGDGGGVVITQVP